MAQLLGGSPSTSSSVFFLELATKTTLERYPQEATSPRKLRSPCLRYCGRPRGARRYRVSSFFVRNCGICTRKWWFSNPFLPQLTPGPRYLPRSSSETQDTTMAIEDGGPDTVLYDDTLGRARTSHSPIVFDCAPPSF